MSASLGSLTLDLIVRLGGFNGPLDDAERRARSSMTNIAKSTDFAKAAFAGLTAVIAGLAGSKLVEVQRQFDVLNAGLLTITKNQAGADAVFGVLTDFAKNTPYDLAQTVEAFTQLVNLGLTPSEQALKAYGNTAAAMGKDLSQMVEAVADAATGEFERLKEFGIKASKQGDQISFTFQGTTTKVKNSATDIENYLIKIGEVNFAGAMENRMKTLDGAMSNLSDNWDGLFRSISGSNIGEAIAEATNMASEGIGNLTDLIRSGAITSALGGIAKAFSLLGSDSKGDIDSIVHAFDGLGFSISNITASAIKDFNQMGKEFTEIRSMIQKGVVSLAVAGDVLFNRDTTISSKSKAFFESIDDINKEAAGRKDAVKKGYDEAVKLKLDFDAKQKMIASGKSSDRLAKYKIDADGKQASASASTSKNKKAKSTADKEENQFKDLQKSADTDTEKNARQFEERMALINRFATQGSAEYTRLSNWAIKENNRATLEIQMKNEDAINQYRDLIGSSTDAMTRQAIKDTKQVYANSDLTKKQQKEAVHALNTYYDNKQDLIELSDRKELAGIESNNLTAMEKIAQRYQFEREQIALNLSLTPKQKESQLNAQNSAEFFDKSELQRNSLKSFSGMQDDINGLGDQKQLSDQLADRQKIIQDALDANVLSVQEAADAKIAIEQDYHQKTSILQLGQAASAADSMANMFGMLLGKQSGAYKVMFAASKAFSIAQSIIAIQTGIAQAFALPFPLNLAAVATVAAESVSIVSNIQSVALAGQAHGGIDSVPREGTWLLSGGERVIKPEQNKDLTRFLSQNYQMNDNSQAQSAQSPDLHNHIYNILDPKMLGDYMKTPDGERAFINTISRNATKISQVVRNA